eukprot:PhM_4_TR10922/c2_g1_i3/m.92196/K15789/TDH; threonine 3-dehydrogenase
MLQRTIVSLSSPKSTTPRILITGALGQIGSDLTRFLRARYGKESVLASDVRMCRGSFVAREDGPFCYLDVQDEKEMTSVIVNNGIDWLVHMAAIKSAKGEADHNAALDVNANGTRNALDVSRKLNLRVFAPSTIAVFGPSSGKVKTLDDTKLDPTTVYGTCKVFNEQLGTYYHDKFGVDFRCLRYPGIISHSTMPGGGTTDYATHVFGAAIKGETFTCGVNRDEPLPMMYMPDCLEATTALLEAPSEKLTRRVYNVTGMSFTPEQLVAEVQKHVPTLEAKYERTHLQDIAHTWPDSLDDSLARRDWGWQPKYDLASMTADMLQHMREAQAAKTK